MKKRLLKVVIAAMLLFCTTNAFAQVVEILQKTSLPNANYYQLKAEADNYLQSLSTADSAIALKEYKKVARWSTFWESRVNNGSAADAGSFLIYAKAQKKLSGNKLFTYGGTITSNWEFVGPSEGTAGYDTGSVMQDMGLVSAICPSPWFGNSINGGVPNKTIYAGSNTGGLFQNTEPNQNWMFANNGMLIPGMGITDIEIKSDSISTILYIATGKARYDRPNYGGGIFKRKCSTLGYIKFVPKSRI